MDSTNRMTTIRLRWKRLAVVQSLLLILLLTQGCSPQPLFDASCATQPVIVTVLYSTEKYGWLQFVTKKYNKQNQCVIVDLIDERGSRDAVMAILNGTVGGGHPGRPTIWSPANTLELQLLSELWQAAHHNPTDIQIIDLNNDAVKPRYVVYSPLVFAVWQSRSMVLSNSHYQALRWREDLHDLLLHALWSDREIGGDGSWGHPKFGQTQPDLSNSGLLTLILMAYAYYGIQSNLTHEEILPPDQILPSGKLKEPLEGFPKFVKDIEDQVWCFGPSSGTYMDTVIRDGPRRFDIITTYESLVLAKENEAKQHWEPLVMYYPPGLNIISDHPFVILQGSWVKDNQLRAAQDYLKFLSYPDQQLSALTFGLRPENFPITYNTPGNLFLQPPPLFPPSSHLKLKEELSPEAQIPKTAVIDALTTLWLDLEKGSPQC